MAVGQLGDEISSAILYESIRRILILIACFSLIKLPDIRNLSF